MVLTLVVTPEEEEGSVRLASPEWHRHWPANVLPMGRQRAISRQHAPCPHAWTARRRRSAVFCCYRRCGPD